MNLDETTPLEDRFTSLLVAYDEALAAGSQPAATGESDTPPELHQRLAEGLECLELLERLWPRRGSALGTPGPANEGAEAAAASQDLPLTRLGRFQIRWELGRGSYGIVFLAYDPQVRREVALKVPRSEVLVTPEVRQRFVREARAAAALDHPNLVPVYEAGEEGPVCFIASAYCPGITLATWLKQRSELVPERLAATLVAVLAEAVHHAHTRGVVHRDLKPSNILLESVARSPCSVAESSPAPQTDHGLRTTDYGLIAKITDFGLAKVFLEGVAGESAPGCGTQSGAIVGTPGYMAPEQAGGHSREVGPAADVYSLGAILYELLTGRPPFRAETPLETLLLVRTQEPVSPARLRPKLRRDLQTICLKCLEKEPRKRYASAAALAVDLRRFLAGEPIGARPVRAWERAVKWSRRRPAVAALLALVAFLTALGFGLVTWQWQRAEAAGQALETKNYFRNIGLAARELEANNMGRAEELLNECPATLRGWEWHYLKRHRGRMPPLQHGNPVHAVTFSPNGEHIASGCEDGTVTVWDATTGRKLRTFEGKGNHDVRSIAYSPDGRLLAASGLHPTVFVWNATTGELITSLSGHHDNVWQVVFSPNGKLLATSSWDTTVRLWDVAIWRPIHTFKDGGSRGMVAAFSPDGERLSAANGDGTVTVWSTSTGLKVSQYQRPIAWVHNQTFSRDCRRIAWGGNDGMARVWDAESGQETFAVEGHTFYVFGLAFSPDGRRLVTAGHDKTVKVWDTTTGQEALTLYDHTGSVTRVAFSPDGQRLASASTDGTVRVWDATLFADQDPDPQTLTLLGHTHRVMGVVFSPDSRRLASASWDGTVKMWDVTTGQEALTFRRHEAFVWNVAFSPDGRQVASTAWDGTVKVWDAMNGQEVHTLGPAESKYVRGVMFSPDGRYLASAHGDRYVRIWDPATGTNIRAFLTGHTNHVHSLAFSSDSRILVSAGFNDKTAKVWDTTTWNEIRSLDHMGPVWSVAFSPDGNQLVSATEDGTVNVWDATTWNLLRSLKGHTDRVYSVAFSPDGRHLASGSGDQTVRIWDAATLRQEPVAVLSDHAASVWSVAFSPDGRRLASASGYRGRGEIKIWDRNRWGK